MAGVPTEGQIQTQWKNAVDILESFRNFVDGTLAGSGGKWDTLEQSILGEYTPELTQQVAGFRATCSTLMTSNVAATMLAPVFYEYGRFISTQGGYGGAYRSAAEVFRAIYEWMIDNSVTIKSRTITYDTVPTPGGGNVGNGTLSRLTVDENGQNLEACHVETKQWRCRSDQNSGAQLHAEVFEVIGQAANYDAILRSSFGSGESARTTMVSKHAGSGSGGSLLQNSSFSEYNGSGSPKFAGWTESAGGAQVSQDLVNYYRTHPGGTTHGSLKITGGGGTVTLKQPLTLARTRRLDPNTPYFLRIMVNADFGTALGGTVTLRLGSQTASELVANIAGNGWTEITIAPSSDCWFRSFNDDPLDVEIEWSGSTSGYLLVDDAILAPWDLIDGTYWCLRPTLDTYTPWQVDDTLEVTDTGGAPATAKLQYWLWVSGYGYLPSSGTPTVVDP